jgi:hypothetical protein
LVESGRREHPTLRELIPELSIALVGGINELVLVTVEQSSAERLDQLEGPIAELVGSVLRRGEPVAL